MTNSTTTMEKNTSERGGGSRGRNDQRPGRGSGTIARIDRVFIGSRTSSTAMQTAAEAFERCIEVFGNESRARGDSHKFESRSTAARCACGSVLDAAPATSPKFIPTLNPSGR